MWSQSLRTLTRVAPPCRSHVSKRCLHIPRSSSGAPSRSFTSVEGRRWVAKGLGVSTFMVGVGLTGVTTVFAEEKSSLAEEKVDIVTQITSPFINAFSFLQEMISGETGPLLPDVQKDVYGRVPRTVVMSFEKTLAYPDWDRDQGWRVRKRPHASAFLEKLARAGYEVVVWSNQHQGEAESILIMLDTLGAIKHRLYKDSTNFKDGRVVKDLTRLNRDLRRVIFIGADANECGYPLENAIPIKPFTNDINDAELLQLTQLLEDIQRYNVYDTRKIIKKFNEDSKTDQFSEEKALELRSKKELEEEESGGRSSKPTRNPSSGGGSNVMGALSGLFGKR